MSRCRRTVGKLFLFFPWRTGRKGALTLRTFFVALTVVLLAPLDDLTEDASLGLDGKLAGKVRVLLVHARVAVHHGEGVRMAHDGDVDSDSLLVGRHADDLRHSGIAGGGASFGGRVTHAEECETETVCKVE